MITSTRLKRARQIIAACIASAIAGFFGVAHYGFADSEPTPQHVPANSIPASDLAGVNATLDHMKQAIAYQQAGNPRDARTLRSRAAHDWILGLDAKQAANISVTHLDNARLYRAIFAPAGDSLGTSAVWLVLPNDTGMPSAIIIRNDNMRAGWLALRDRTPVAPLYVVETITCQTTSTIVESRNALPPRAIQSLAEARATKLADETIATAGDNQSCRNLKKMLPLSGATQTASLDN